MLLAKFVRILTTLIRILTTLVRILTTLVRILTLFVNNLTARVLNLTNPVRDYTCRCQVPGAWITIHVQQCKLLDPTPSSKNWSSEVFQLAVVLLILNSQSFFEFAPLACYIMNIAMDLESKGNNAREK
jgi:hypothetical protein